MADRESAEEKLATLRELIVNARSMPMSASCVINRGEVLDAIDQVIADLPDEIAEAADVVEQNRARVAAGHDEAADILAEAREHAERLARHSEVVRVAEQVAERVRQEAENDVAALRQETDAFIDSRMASFESVLHKTTSQVRTARARLAERSNLDGEPAAPAPAGNGHGAER